MTLRLFNVSIVCIIFGILNGCQLSIDDSEGGIGGTGLIKGRVTTVETFRVEGEPVQVNDAVFVRNSRPFSGNHLGFQIGEYITISNRNLETTGRTRFVEYSAPVVGPISQLSSDTNELVVVGQTVVLTDLVIFANFSSIDDLELNKFIEVSGYRDVNDVLHATRLTLVPGTSEFSTIRLVGPVNVLGRQTLSIGGATIRLDSLPVDQHAVIESLSDGDIVVTSLKANRTTGATEFDALSVQAQTPLKGETVALLSGSLSGYSGLSQPFTVNGYSVRLTESTILDDGGLQLPLSTLLNDPLVGITEITAIGTFDEQGQLIASRIIYLPIVNQIDIVGQIDSIDSASSSLTVNGIQINFSGITLFVTLSTAPGEDGGDDDARPAVDTVVGTGEIGDVFRPGEQVFIRGIQHSDSSIFARLIRRLPEN